MIYVLDTCAAISVAFNGEKSEQYKSLIMDADKILAPTLFDSEITNVLWRYVKGGYLDEENAKKTLAYLLQIVDEFVPTSELALEALHESIRLNHSVYDMLFLVLARRYSATLITSDEKLRLLAVDQGVNLSLKC